MTRARLGEAPGWIVRCVVATWAGLPLVVLLSLGASLAYGKVAGDDPPRVPVREVVTSLHLVIVAVLARGYVTHRPLDAVERGYYRMALFAVAVFGLTTVWLVGALGAALLLLHSFLDKAVVPVEGPVPVTAGHRAWLEGRGDRQRPDGR